MNTCSNSSTDKQVSASMLAVEIRDDLGDNIDAYERFIDIEEFEISFCFFPVFRFGGEGGRFSGFISD